MRWVRKGKQRGKFINKMILSWIWNIHLLAYRRSMIQWFFFYMYNLVFGREKIL
jgi:hypothetical protein